MAWRNGSSRGFRFAITTIIGTILGTILLCCALVSPVQALYGHVDIANSFRSPTEFTCHSNRMSRQTYTATWYEIYYFGFNTGDHQYWDCEVYNRGWNARGTFRFWGDDSHGGTELFSCFDCVWNVQERGVFFYLDGVWRYKYHWNSAP